MLDASVAAAWAFDDEDHPDAAMAFERMRTDEAIVPTLWWFEVRNAFVISERRKRISEATTTAFLGELSRLPIAMDTSPEELAVFALSRHHALSFYDAAYVELAKRRHLPLSTLDGAMARAALAEQLELIRVRTP